jgi:hypothetical protein
MQFQLFTEDQCFLTSAHQHAILHWRIIIHLRHAVALAYTAPLLTETAYSSCCDDLNGALMSTPAMIKCCCHKAIASIMPAPYKPCNSL